MKYKEFEEKIKDWGRRHSYATEVAISEFETALKVEFNGELYFISNIVNTDRFVLETNLAYFTRITVRARAELFDILVELAKTPPEERKDEKRFIIPLHGLVTTDGKQQYLTHKDCKFFACRRDETLRQTWKEEHLKFVPEQYRQFAEERQYDYLYDMYIDEFED